MLQSEAVLYQLLAHLLELLAHQQCVICALWLGLNSVRMILFGISRISILWMMLSVPNFVLVAIVAARPESMLSWLRPPSVCKKTAGGAMGCRRYNLTAHPPSCKHAVKRVVLNQLVLRVFPLPYEQWQQQIIDLDSGQVMATSLVFLWELKSFWQKPCRNQWPTTPCLNFELRLHAKTSNHPLRTLLIWISTTSAPHNVVS
jgi:hypothetical protein